MARRRRSGFFKRVRSRTVRVARRGRSRVTHLAARARRFGGGLTSGLPSWAKPSRVIAYTGIATGVLQLTVTPLSNGDSWIRRLQTGYTTYTATKNPFDLLAMDPEGNNALTILSFQLQQNALPAAGTIVGFGIGAAILKRFGM